MPATLDLPNCDMAMLARIVEPERGNLSLAAARAFLKFKFDQGDLDRMHELLEKVRRVKLTEQEQAEFDDYERVGNLLDLLHSKARKSLKKHTNGH